MTQVRKIVHIDEDKCDGCGVCVPSCAEGAIQVIDGKARLVADNLCDGLGNCLGTCPKDAIRIESRPAEAFDEEAVAEHVADEASGPVEGDTAAADEEATMACGCPSTLMRMLDEDRAPAGPAPDERPRGGTIQGGRDSHLGHWPVQLTLLPERGKVWDGAEVLLSADCVAYAMGDFHERLLAGRSLAVACPKLDDAGRHQEKLTRVLAGNDVRSLTVARMEVPCCGGLEQMARSAIAASGKHIPLTVVVIGADGAVKSVNGLDVAG